MLEPNLERFRESRWKGRPYKRNFVDDIFGGFTKIQNNVKTLDVFAEENGIHHVDYLKIDVEGSEYEVFQGSRSLLASTRIIKVEICFIPFRKGQKLFPM